MPATRQPMPIYLRLTFAFLFSTAAGLSRLQTQFAWKTIEYNYRSNAIREAAIHSGAFIPGNSIPLDVDTWREAGSDNSVFISLPRLKPGVPATLVKVVPNSSENASSPLVEPFPDWNSNLEGNCNGLTSVFRMKIDHCGRLWVLDSGTVDVSNTSTRICQPKVVVYDVKTRKLLYTMSFSDSVLKSDSLLITIAVDSRGPKCLDSWAYIADVTGYGLIVLDTQGGIGTNHGINGRVGRYWKAISNMFYGYPPAGYFDLNGVQFELMDGVFGLALGPLRSGGDGIHRGGGDRTLFFHSLASFHESWVDTSILRNSSNFENGVNAVPKAFQVTKGERNSQAAASDMDEGGILYFSLLKYNTLNCWNSKRPYIRENIIELDKDDEQLQFLSGLKVIPAPNNHQQVWGITSRFQRLFASGMDPNEYNFHVLAADTVELTRGTKCASKPIFQGEATASFSQPSFRRQSSYSSSSSFVQSSSTA